MENNLSINTATLEEIIQEDRAQEIDQLHGLSKKVCYLHTDLLYYRNPKSKIGSACYEAWRTLMRKVGGTPNCWRDLGYALGVIQDDLDYIMASVKDDPADMVLKVYRQNDNATLDKVVDAFIKMERYDILKALEDPLCQVAQYFNKSDSGYHSNGKSVARDIVTLKNLPNDLPPALNKNIIIEHREPNSPKQPLPTSCTKHNEKIENDKPILFLTFAQDGFPTSINIMDYVNSWVDIPGVKVITLSSRKDEVYQNPEKYIRQYFEMADLVVPIITPGYLEEISSHTVSTPNTTENLDHKYVRFIYKLIVNNYIHATGCLNTKVRSVLPQNTNSQLFTSISMYPDLLPWTYETDFDEQFQEFLRK